MADELQTDYLTGKVVYFLLRNATGEIWNGSFFESYLSANYSTYDILATEQGNSGYYVANFPSVAAGVYYAVAKERVGGSPAETDFSVGWGNIDWGGSAVAVFASGTVWLASGHPATLYSGQIAQVYSGNLSGQIVTAASGAFVVASVASGQFVNVYSGQLSGQQVNLLSGNQTSVVSGTSVNVFSGQLSGQLIGVHSGTIFPASGSTQIASGPFVVGSLLSGQFANVYSGQLSGQLVSLLSGAFYPASGAATLSSGSASDVALKVLTYNVSGIQSGTIPPVSVGSMALKLTSRFNAKSGSTYLPDGVSVHGTQAPVNGSGMFPISELGVMT